MTAASCPRNAEESSMAMNPLKRAGARKEGGVGTNQLSPIYFSSKLECLVIPEPMPLFGRFAAMAICAKHLALFNFPLEFLY